MHLIKIKDAGLARNEKYNVTVGVIHLLVSNRGEAPSKVTGFCDPKNKPDIMSALRKIIWEQPTC